MSPKIIIGLGNPGPEYQKTRHNVGFLVLQKIAEITGFEFKKPWFKAYEILDLRNKDADLILVKPLTYMNRSGQILPYILRKYKSTPQDCYVVVDNMDLFPGQQRYKQKGSDAGHNGLKSLIEYFGDSGFHRFYIGIGRPKGMSVVDHVLGNMDSDERSLIEGSIEKTAKVILDLADNDHQKIARMYNL